MDKGTLVMNICRNYCSYFKPSKKEESACRGFTVIEQLVEDGLDLPSSVELRRSGESTEEIMRAKLCKSCSYQEKDCDFAERLPGAPPCGGFLLLSRIIEDKAVPVDDILKKF